MSLQRLADLLATEPTIAEILDARPTGLTDLDLKAPAALRPFLTTLLAKQSTVLVVTATAREAEDLVEDLAELVGQASVAYYPPWETLPHERLSPRSDTVGRRLAVLRRLVHPAGVAEAGPIGVILSLIHISEPTR